MRSLLALGFYAMSSMAIANGAPLLMTEIEVKAHTEKMQSLTGEAREAYRNNAYEQLKQRAVELGYALPERPPWASATSQEEILKMEAMITIQRAVIEEAKAQLAAKAAAAKQKPAPSEPAKSVVSQAEAPVEKPAEVAAEAVVSPKAEPQRHQYVWPQYARPVFPQPPQVQTQRWVPQPLPMVPFPPQRLPPPQQPR
jgi:cell envelope opacity-associated protein A